MGSSGIVDASPIGQKSVEDDEIVDVVAMFQITQLLHIHILQLKR